MVENASLKFLFWDSKGIEGEPDANHAFAIALHSGVQAIEEYVSVVGRGFEMMSEKYQSAFYLNDEPAALREAYGEEFGQRLLLSRRIVEHEPRTISEIVRYRRQIRLAQQAGASGERGRGQVG